MSIHEFAPNNETSQDVPFVSLQLIESSQAPESLEPVVIPEVHEQMLDVDLVLCHNPTTPSWKQAEDIEYSVFKAMGYVEKRKKMQADYAPYESVSQMVTARQDGKVVGCIRMMTYQEGVGFKTLNDAKREETDEDKLDISDEGWALINSLDPKSIVEVGTIGLEDEYRTRQGADEHMVTSLYGAIYARSMAMGTPNILASFDEEYLGRFTSLFGPAITPIGPGRDYMGSVTVPVIMNTDEIHTYFESIGAGAFVDELASYGDRLTEEH